MRIVWHSNAPWAATGYGQQTAEFAPRIRDLGHDVAISAFWGLGGGPVPWEGMEVYPADENWGNRNLPHIVRRHGDGEPVLVITLMDVWVLTSPAIRALEHVAAWTPVDHAPAPPRVLDYFENTGTRPIAMSRFGEKMLAEFDPLYVPHGIDTRTFRPRDERRPAVRETLIGVPEDAFVVGMVAANKGMNPPRKGFPQLFTAFGEFRRTHPDAYLYLHTDLTGRHDGVNLGALAAAAGIPLEAVKYTNPFVYEMGVEPETLADLYSAFDVLASPSFGEGFGIPIVEAQACGTPVIVTDWTAMTELCGAGWLVDGDPWYDATQGSYFKCPSVTDIYDALGAAYDKRGDADLRIRAREFAVDYDAGHVLDTYWKPALDAITPQAKAEVETEVFVRGGG